MIKMMFGFPGLAGMLITPKLVQGVVQRFQIFPRHFGGDDMGGASDIAASLADGLYP
jgi:hypothetical protein